MNLLGLLGTEATVIAEVSLQRATCLKVSTMLGGERTLAVTEVREFQIPVTLRKWWCLAKALAACRYFSLVFFLRV